MTPPAARRPPALTWQSVVPAPVVLVTGSESVLAERAVARVHELCREADPEVEVTRLDAATYHGGELAVVTSPSLFGGSRLVVVQDLAQATEELIGDLARYAAAPEPDAVLVVVHGGGQRARKVLDQLRAGGHPTVSCEPVKRDADKQSLVTAEFRRLGRRADASATRALVDALGSDLRELLAACAQLAADTTGTVTAEVVARYHGARVEATGFRVADAAVSGAAGEAVALLRHALSTGTDAVPVIAALAAKLRTLAKVSAARGRGLDPVADLGLAPWQVDRARRELTAWTPESLAVAISAVARADAEVKGAGRDPVFAVERAVLTVASAAAAR